MKETTDFPFPEAFENALHKNEKLKNSVVHYDFAKKKKKKKSNF